MTPKPAWRVAILQRPWKPDGRYGWLPAARAARTMLEGDAFLLSIALERVTIERFMLARVVAAAVVPRSAAESPGTFVVGWRPPPFGRRHSVRGPILISFSFKLVSDQSLIGSGVASVRRKLPRL